MAMVVAVVVAAVAAMVVAVVVAMVMLRQPWSWLGSWPRSCLPWSWPWSWLWWPWPWPSSCRGLPAAAVLLRLPWSWPWSWLLGGAVVVAVGRRRGRGHRRGAAVAANGGRGVLFPRRVAARDVTLAPRWSAKLPPFAARGAGACLLRRQSLFRVRLLEEFVSLLRLPSPRFGYQGLEWSFLFVAAAFFFVCTRAACKHT